MDAAIPEVIRWHGTLDLPPAASEAEVLAELRELADRNTVAISMIGLGYYGTHTPGVIRRNVLESPAWYTAYTPYQPEISQGRLEALLNFQTMVTDLTGLATANASMLDEGTAAAEAMTLARRSSKAKSNVYVVDADTLPQTIAVIQTRAEPLGIEVVLADAGRGEPAGGVLRAAPAVPGRVRRGARPRRAGRGGARARARWSRSRPTCSRCACCARRARSAPTSPSAPPSASACRWASAGRTPATWPSGPAWSGRCRAGWSGVSRDADGNPAYRLALQTREQHIRREKATSNICTAQVLLAVMASMYAVYHGPDGLRGIAGRTHRMAATARRRAARHPGHRDHAGVLRHGHRCRCRAGPPRWSPPPPSAGVNLRLVDADRVSVACDETTTVEHLRAVWAAFGVVRLWTPAGLRRRTGASPAGLRRTSEFLTHPVFHAHRSETAMLRYLRSLADKDYALDRGHDPARLVHDEAQRHHRDGAGDLARVRQHAPVRAGRRRPPGTPSW